MLFRSPLALQGAGPDDVLNMIQFAGFELYEGDDAREDR